MKRSGKCFAVWIAAVLIWMSGLTVLAAEASPGSADDTSAEVSAGVAAEEANVEASDSPQAPDRIRTTLFVAGCVFVFAGVGGFVCMFIWHGANRRRDHSEEDMERILDEIQQAEQRVREQRSSRAQQTAVVAAPSDRYNTQENDFTVPAEPQNAPIVPSTPVSMQPKESVRARVQPMPPQSAPKAAEKKMRSQPMPAAEKKVDLQPIPTAERKADPQPTPAAQKPKYDVDDILREIREGKLY